MKKQNEYLICLIPPDSPQYFYWAAHGFHYLGVANRYKTPKSANAVLKTILDPNTIANEKLPANWQERGYKLEVRHESKALCSDAVLGGTDCKPKPGDAVLGNKSRVDRAISLCREYSAKAAFLAKRLHDQRWTISSQELLKVAENLSSRPDLVSEIEEAYKRRTEKLSAEEWSPEWQMFREIDRGLLKAQQFDQAARSHRVTLADCDR